MLNFYLAAFLADLALGAVLLSIPLFLIYMFGATSLILGMFGAVGALVYSLGVIVVGRMADRFNRRTILLLGCALFAATYLVLPFLKTTAQILTVYIFGSASMAMFWPVLQSWLSQGLNKHNLMRSLTIFNVSWCGGLMLGFLSAGFLFSFNPKLPFALGVVLIACAATLLYKQPLKPAALADAGAAAEPEEKRPANYKAFLYAAWCANFVSWFIIGIMRNLFPKLGTELGFSTGVIGTLIFIITLAQTVMFFVLGKTHRWHYKLGLLVLFQAFAMIGLLAVYFFSNAATLGGAMILLGLSAGMTYFSSIFYSLYGSTAKGKHSGIHEAFLGTGGLFGPLAGGLLAAGIGIRAPYIAAAVVVIVAIAAETVLIKIGTMDRSGRKK
ncbi:MAG: MFS transporter [Candidatus Omnitrophota bacterium]|nr:MFS transporter [Candidatus Omnitrophota bacterium]